MGAQPTPASPYACHHFASSAARLDSFDLRWIELKVEDREIILHVRRAGRARQRQHARVEREPEDNLGSRAGMTLGEPLYLGMAQNIAIGRQQGESLVGDSGRGAELADTAIPA